MTELHSVRSDVWAQLKAETTEKIPRAAEKFAMVRAHLNGLEADLNKTFEKYEQVRGVLEEGGVVAQMKLSPILDAAHGAWLRSRDVPKRLELTELPEAPIPPEGDE